MTTGPEGANEGRTVELQIDGRQLLIVVVGMILLCAVFFYFGRRVGRSEAGVQGSSVAAPEAALPAEDAGGDLTFFDRVAEGRVSGGPPPVVSGVTRPAPGSNGSRPSPPDVDRPGPSPMPQAPAGRPAATAAPGGVEIQVAVVSERARAEDLAARLRAKGYAASTSSTASNGRTVWRVRVGGYPSREAARTAAARLEREENLKTWIPEGR